MDNPQKIPIIFLLKKSRQECGELKSYVMELEDTIKNKDIEYAALERKFNVLHTQFIQQKKKYSTKNHVKTVVTNLSNAVKKAKLNKYKKPKLYAKIEKRYNDWFNGCKELITLMGELKSPSK